MNQWDKYRPIQSATLNIKKQTRASNSLPNILYDIIYYVLCLTILVQTVSLGYGAVDLMLLMTAGNSEIVTANTIKTLTAYTDI